MTFDSREVSIAMVGLNKCDFTFDEILAFLEAPVFLGVFTPNDNLPCFGLPRF